MGDDPRSNADASPASYLHRYSRLTCGRCSRRRMAAISGLQQAQYGEVFATGDHVEVDYAAWARAIRGVAAFDGVETPEALAAALDEARKHTGLSLIHVPVYCGPDPLGGLGAYGRWNVGNWVTATQALRHEIGL